MPAGDSCILVVEDDAANLRLLAMVLELEGYTVATTPSLAQAIAFCESRTFDLVLTDSFSHSPAAALSSTTSLRQAAGNTPMILLTAHKIDPIDAYTAGFAAVLGKPFAIDDLLIQVAKVLPAGPPA